MDYEKRDASKEHDSIEKGIVPDVRVVTGTSNPG